MARLANLGMPFGSPGGIINIPAPAGSALAGQMQMQAMQGLGQALGAYFGQRRQGQLQQQDIGNYRNAQQLATDMGMGVEQLPSWLMPPMQSRVAQQMQMQSQLGQMFPAPADPFSLDPGAGQYTGAGQLVAERESEPMPPTQQIASRKLAKIDSLQKKVREGTATEGEKAMLEKMLAGQPMVQIGLGRPASPTERKEIAETRASIDALDNLKTLFDSAQTKTGPLVGRYSPIAGLVGMTTDEQEAFMAATSAFKNAIIKEITGAQMSEQEASRIMKQVPDITDPSTRWNAKWQQSKRNLEFLQKRRLEILRQSGIRVPGGQGSVDIRNMSDEELRRIAGER